MSNISEERLSFLMEAAEKAVRAKTYADTYLYSKGNYDKQIFGFLMRGTRVDKSHKSFEDIRYEIKRSRTTSALSKVLDSPNTILVMAEEPLPLAFKVFSSADPKDSGNKKKKLFIDVTGIIKETEGNYTYKPGDMSILMSYLMGGMNTLIYAADPTKVYGKSSLVDAGCRCFSNLVYYIVDYLRLSSDPQLKSKIQYLSSMYFQICMLGRSYSESIENRAKKISGVTEQQINVINIFVGPVENPYENIKTFCEAIKLLTRSEKFTVDVFIDRWLFILGSGTQFATELYPAFANMIIYAYIGAYLNNQKAIEKAAGRDMVDFVNQVIYLGNEVLK